MTKQEHIARAIMDAEVLYPVGHVPASAEAAWSNASRRERERWLKLAAVAMDAGNTYDEGHS